MILKRDPTKALQWGFLAMLIVATAQVGWWIADQRWLARDEQDRIVALFEADADAVTALLGDRATPGHAAWALVADELPHLVLDPVARSASVRPEAVDRLAGEVASRINRYAWEGGFFLLVLIVGMSVLTRAIRHDAQLRRRQQNFIAAVSHEFKSPLASMRLSAETLAARGGDEDSRRLGRRLVEDGDRLLRLVDNLLDTARVDDGRIGLRRENVPLRAVVEAARAEHSLQAGRRGIDIRVDVPDVDLDADPLAIESVIRNLSGQCGQGLHPGGWAEDHHRGPSGGFHGEHRDHRRRHRLSAPGGGPDLRQVLPLGGGGRRVPCRAPGSDSTWSADSLNCRMRGWRR